MGAVKISTKNVPAERYNRLLYIQGVKKELYNFEKSI
jgi:hypothetical protein